MRLVRQVYDVVLQRIRLGTRVNSMWGQKYVGLLYKCSDKGALCLE